LLDAGRDYFSVSQIGLQLKDTLILYEFAR
jgi:hypothetical protein